MADTALNVSFLKGTQSKLNGLTSYQAGAFYLTEDTDRLYFAQSASELVYLNKYITTVATKDNLPALSSVQVGDFYYVASGNILCTKATDAADAWTQINPKDKNDNTKVTGLTFTTATKGTDIEVDCTLVQKKTDADGNVTEEPSVTGKITISGSDIGAVVTGISLDVNATVANNAADIALVGSGVAADATGFKITGGENVTITGSNNNINIASKNSTYTLGSAANSTGIVLKDNAGTPNTVNIVAGTSNSSVAVTGAAENQIVVAHKDYTYSKAALANQTPANAGSFNIVSGVTLENGHVTGVSTSSVTLPNMTYTIKSVAADANGKISVTLADHKGDGAAVSSGQELYYTVKGAKVYNQGSLTDHFYTKSEIDATLQGANAMTFKGSVGANETLTALPTSGVKAGDTYIVVGETVVVGSGNNGHEGDLFIASGNEGTNGTIAKDDIVWIHVPAGDEINTTYGFSFQAGKGLVIHDNASGNETVLACEGDSAIEVTTNGKLAVAHKNVTRTDGKADDKTLGSNTEFTVVTGVSSNAQGHITGITTQKMTMPAEDVYSLARADANTVNLKDKDGNIDGTIKISAGDNLVVSSTDNNKGANFTVAHGTATVATASAAAVTLNAQNAASNKSFTVITGIEDDGHGHISKITTTQYNMPYDSTYTLAGAVANNTVTHTLKDRSGNKVSEHAFTLASNNLTVTTSGSTITADLQWGSF